MTTEQILDQLHDNTIHAIQVELLEILQANDLVNNDKALNETDYKLMNTLLKKFFNKTHYQKAYYLFGEGAVRIFEDEGVDALIEEYENYEWQVGCNEVGYLTYCYDQSKDTPTDLLYEAQGMNDFAVITEEEYNKLNQ
jgi:hypothetical protein